MDTVSFKSRRARQADPNQTGSASTEVQDVPIDLEKLAGLWKAVLRVDSANPDDNFFELGGTSLHAMLLASRVESVLSLQMSLVSFFEEPTFARFCASVAEG